MKGMEDIQVNFEGRSDESKAESDSFKEQVHKLQSGKDQGGASAKEMAQFESNLNSAGFEMTIVPHIGMSTKRLNDLKSVLTKMSVTFEPALADKTKGPLQVQRCPAVWVDQILLFIKNEVVHMALGYWSKKVDGEMVSGLVLPAGGHYETMGRRVVPTRGGGEPTPMRDAGDMSALEAANKELEEEVGIHTSDVVMTELVATMDRLGTDTTRHGISYIFVRVVTKEPTKSEEIKSVFSLPVDTVKQMIVKNSTITAGPHKNVGFIKGHGTMTGIVLQLPRVKTILGVMQAQISDKYHAAPPAYF